MVCTGQQQCSCDIPVCSGCWISQHCIMQHACSCADLQASHLITLLTAVTVCSAADQPVMLHLTELTVHELQRLASEMPALLRADQQLNTSSRSKASQQTASLPAQPAQRTRHPASTHADQEQRLSQAAGAQPPELPGTADPCVVLTNQLQLPLLVGQAGTDEALSIKAGACLLYRCSVPLLAVLLHCHPDNRWLLHRAVQHKVGWHGRYKRKCPH